MLRKYFPYLFLFIMLGSIVFVEVNKPKPVNWTPSFSNSDKIPYGTYILFDRIKDLFPGEEVNTVKVPIYNQLTDRVEELEDAGTQYVFINNDFVLSELDAELLFEFVEDGNGVFVSALNFDLSSIGDTFELDTDRSYYFSEMGKSDSIELGNNFVHPDLATEEGFPSKGRYVDTYFTRFDSSQVKILGVNKEQKANFIKIKYGLGEFYLNTTPYALTNYNMLHAKSMEYASKLISHLEPGKVYWDEYYKSGKKEATTSLRYFLSHYPLKWMIYLIVAGSVIFLLFEGKRKQRIIPILEERNNSSIEFVEAMSDLYLSKNNHKDLAEKKIKYFYEYLRTKLNIREIVHGEELVRQIAIKTGISQEDLKRLFLIIRNIDQKPAIYDTELILLNKRIDEFYSEAETISK